MFLGALGEFFRGLAKVRLLLGEFFRGLAKIGLLLGEFSTGWAVAGRVFSRGDAEVAGCSNVIACWRHPVKRRHWPSRENTTRPRAATALATRSCAATAPTVSN